MFKDIMVEEDMELVRASYAIYNDRDPTAQSHREFVPSEFFEPFATSLYRMFPEDKDPLVRLCELPLPLKLDVSGTVTLKEAQADGKKTADVVIPAADLEKMPAPGRRSIRKYLKTYLSEKFDKLASFEDILTRVVIVRSIRDEESRQRFIQVWLHVMQRAKASDKKQSLSALKNFSHKGLLQDIISLLKVTTDKKTCI